MSVTRQTQIKADAMSYAEDYYDNTQAHADDLHKNLRATT